jgi:hypothetical protein
MAIRRDPLDRDRWARLRFAIIGPLLAAPPDAGALRATLTALASTTRQHPTTGLPVTFGISTLERWFYRARRARLDPVAALKTSVRTDVGRSRVMTTAVIEALTAQYNVFALGLHASRRDRPACSVQINLRPSSTARLTGSDGGKDGEFKTQCNSLTRSGSVKY